MRNSIGVFISSKQVELEVERAVLADKIRSIPFLEPIIAKEWPSERRTIQEVFLDEVRQAPIYVGLFHRVYSAPTEMEYRAALENPYREVLIYLKHSAAAEREPALQTLVSELEQQHAVVAFNNISELLPIFTNHLCSALNRMIALLQKLGEAPPTTRATRSGSSLTQRWANQREALLQLGLPADAQAVETARAQLSAAVELLSAK